MELKEAVSSKLAERETLAEVNCPTLLALARLACVREIHSPSNTWISVFLTSTFLSSNFAAAIFASFARRV